MTSTKWKIIINPIIYITYLIPLSITEFDLSGNPIQGLIPNTFQPTYKKKTTRQRRRSKLSPAELKGPSLRMHSSKQPQPPVPGNQLSSLAPEAVPPPVLAQASAPSRSTSTHPPDDRSAIPVPSTGHRGRTAYALGFRSAVSRILGCYAVVNLLSVA